MIALLTPPLARLLPLLWGALAALPAPLPALGVAGGVCWLWRAAVGVLEAWDRA